MKKKLLTILVLLPLFSFGQVQIGDDIDGETSGDQSGSSLSLSSDGTIVAIGAPSNNGNGGGSGHVRIYENQSGVWVQIGDDIDGEAPDDFSGSSLSLSSDGTIIAIGASSNGANFSGHVRIYENQSGVWVQIGNDIDGEGSGDQSGISLSLSSDGTIVAIGANLNNGNGNFSGHVRIYENQSGVWVQIGDDIDGEASDDFSGRSVSLSSDGTIVAIGALTNDGNGGGSGHVRMYENQSGIWVQIGDDIDGEAPGDFSGLVSLSSDGTIVAIGAEGNDDGNGVDSGHVRIYENQSGIWTQIGQDIDGEESGDQSGRSVSLSSDGTIVAIGADSNNGNGNFSGHVRTYENQSGVWVQIGDDIDGEAIEDFSGRVSLSSNGATVAIGALNNDGNGNNSGHVRVFDLSALLSTEEVSQFQFSIYPNPTSTSATIQLEQENYLQKAVIYNSLGQVVKTSRQTTIDTSDLSKGVYIVDVITVQGRSSQKLIIE